MPRDDGIAVLRISSVGLRKYEGVLDLDTRDLKRQLQEVFEEIGGFAETVLWNHAPKRTGRLREGIHITGRNRSTSRPNIRIGVDAVSDEGFPYLGVTRFGRRAVVAKNISAPAKTYETDHPRGQGVRGIQRRPFRRHTLRFEPGPPGSGFIFRHRVRAFRPKGDWVGRAEPEIREGANEIMEEFTDEIAALFRGNRARGRMGGPRLVATRRLR